MENPSGEMGFEEGGCPLKIRFLEVGRACGRRLGCLGWPEGMVGLIMVGMTLVERTEDLEVGGKT